MEIPSARRTPCEVDVEPAREVSNASNGPDDHGDDRKKDALELDREQSRQAKRGKYENPGINPAATLRDKRRPVGFVFALWLNARANLPFPSKVNSAARAAGPG
ncbi:MAG: hypothetical protein AMXMBFR47_26320 [Planctomycetota bacterium]